MMDEDPAGEASDDGMSNSGIEDVDDLLSISGSDVGNDETEMENEVVFAKRQLNNMGVDAILT